MPTHRIETDFIGDKQIPIDSYYGIQTKRAFENFNITKATIGEFQHLISALAKVKKAAALANIDIAGLTPTIGAAIVAACDEIIKGKFINEFIVDPLQGGAGTSTNMNANEVIANRALEILGHPKGSYHIISPNGQVNLSQSTNDVYPTALKLALYDYVGEFKQTLRHLASALTKKSKQFTGIIKVGRTQLQDAVPMTLSQEFKAYATTMLEDITRLSEVQKLLLETNMGATAIGTGINANPKYRQTIIKKLKEVTQLKIIGATDMIEATSDTGVFVQLSSIFKRTAIKLNKIANDLRLLNSGPIAGFGDINLPMVQPGSSIMPGKVNPVIPEMINQIVYKIIGNDLTITLAASNGQLQLNAFEPVIAFSLFRNTIMLTNGIEAFINKCIAGITANQENCLQMVLNSNVLATAISSFIGYEQTSLLVKTAENSNIPVYQLALEQNLITQDQLNQILDPKNMT